MLFPVQNEGFFFSNFIRKQNGESENFPINPINAFLGDLRFFFLLPVKKTLGWHISERSCRRLGQEGGQGI